MAVPGPQRHCLTALHRVYMQDPKRREDVVLRVHLLRWHHHQAIGPLKKSSDQQGTCAGARKGPKRDGEAKRGGRNEGRGEMEDRKENRMTFKLKKGNRCNFFF